VINAPSEHAELLAWLTAVTEPKPNDAEPARMARYYVETRLPPERVEASQVCPTFDAAMHWLVGRLNENPQRVGRMVTNETITPKQAAMLSRCRIARG
jgi:hypothetical protein